MRFRKSGTHDPTALDLPRKVQPINFAQHSPWTRLDRLLGIIKKHRSDILLQYVTNLQQRYEDLAKTDFAEENSIKLLDYLAEFSLLSKHPDLASSNLNYFLQNLQAPKDTDYENDIIEISQRNQLRAVLCPKYQNILVLTETIDRNEAIELYKIYHDTLMRDGRSSQENRFETLNDFADRWFQPDTIDSPGLVRVVSEVRDGKLYLRKDTCLWNDAIEDLEDSELKYYVCCYGDFESARQANRNFVLTMERTIIEGHPFCDSVFHDTRISTTLIHPSEDFFANMNPDV